MSDGYKFVEFDKFCPTCEYKDKEESEDPCFDCLGQTVNFGSVKPVKYSNNKPDAGSLSQEKQRS